MNEALHRILTCICAVGILAGCSPPDKEQAAASKTPLTADVLVGRWLRPDGGYILDLQDIGSTGSVTAAYLNPRPINVSRAEWRQDGGQLTLFVELRDVNYPGSTYTLAYQVETDRLTGIYHHAGLHQDFDVEFVRRQE